MSERFRIVRPLMMAAIVALAVPAAAQEMKGEALFQALKAGGYVIYFRHSITDTSQSDRDPVDVGDCATQRNLSEEGRAQARAIGWAFKALGIAVDKVISSPFCRAKETAALAFGSVEPVDTLYYSFSLSKEAAAQAAARLEDMLSRAPEAGRNTVMVGHTTNIRDVAGIWPKTEGAAVVLQPIGGGFHIVGAFSAAELIKAGG